MRRDTVFGMNPNSKLGLAVTWLLAVIVATREFKGHPISYWLQIGLIVGVLTCGLMKDRRAARAENSASASSQS